MKSDIDQLLIDNQAAGLWVTGPAQHNPAMVYLTGGGHMTMADVIKPVGKPMTLCHAPMEREEAARTGLQTINYTQFPLKARLEAAKGDRVLAQALLYKEVFEQVGLTEGTVLLYGRSEVGKHYSLVSKLQELLPGLTFKGDLDDAVLLQAMATKDAAEIERIRAMAVVVRTVVSRVADFLTHHKVVDETLVKEDGSPLTIGDVKGLINLWLAELGAENPEGHHLRHWPRCGYPPQQRHTQ